MRLRSWHRAFKTELQSYPGETTPSGPRLPPLLIAHLEVGLQLAWKPILVAPELASAHLFPKHLDHYGDALPVHSDAGEAQIINQQSIL